MAGKSSAVPGNVHVKLAFDSLETLSGVAPRNIGFKLAVDNKGIPQFRAHDDAPRLLVERVRRAGFQIDEHTLEITFEKNAWDGPFGAYTERPGSNRPAYGVNVDFRRPKPTIGPKEFVVGRPVLTAASGIVFTAADNSINDATGRLAQFVVNDTISVTGTTSNNWSDKSIVTSSATKITVAAGIVSDESPSTATITARAFGGPIVSAALYKNDHYILSADGNTCYVYKLANWSQTDPSQAYWVRAYKPANNGTPEQLYVHNGIMYLARGDDPYQYYDGTNWYESSRSGDNGKASRFFSLDGYLHKVLKPAKHQQLPAKSDTGENGGTAWASADQIGDTSYDIMEAASLKGNLVFPKEDGVHTMDSGGNIRTLLDLRSVYQPGNGYSARVWDAHDMLVYPLLSGHTWAYKNGGLTMITPSLQQERPMEVISSEQPSLSSPIHAIVSTPQFLFVTLDYGNLIRVLCAEEYEQGLFWRTFVEGGSIMTGDFLWFTFDPSTWSNRFIQASPYVPYGPALWAASGTIVGYAYAPVCWPLHVGTDPLQDSNARFASTSSIYEPWLAMGCPETDKRFSFIEVVVRGSHASNCSLNVKAYDDSATPNKILDADATMALIPTLTTSSYTTTSGNHVCKRSRLVFTLANSDSQESPELLSYRVHAFALPTPKRTFEMTVDVSAAGVGGGVARQKEARDFLKTLQGADYPLTLTDPFGSTFTVVPVVTTPAEATMAGHEYARWDEVAQITLVELPTGV